MIVQTAVRQHRDNIQIMRSTFLTSIKAQNCQIFAQLGVIWQCLIADPKELTLYLMQAQSSVLKKVLEALSRCKGNRFICQCLGVFLH
jgi:hypothetical protein